MKNCFTGQYILMISALTCSAQTFAEQRPSVEPYGFIYGFGLSISQEIYKDYDKRIIPLPIIGYKGENLNVFGPFISYDVADFNNLSLAVKLAPRFAGFDENDSAVFTGMDTRKSSLDAGIAVNYKFNNTRISSSLLADVLGNYNGYEVATSLSYVWRLAPVFIEPSVAIKYQDANMVNYYYGVRSHEATPSRIQYSPDYALNSTVGISVATHSILGGLTKLGITKTWYGDAITASPLVETDATSGLSLLLSYSRFF